MASFIAPEIIPTSRASTPFDDFTLNRLARLPRLPDLLTTANLCCGVASILLASQGQLTIACGLIFLAAVFDVFDGLAARALGGGTPLGAQLDSLADMVSFGVAPAMLVWFWAIPLIEIENVANVWTVYPPLSALPDATAVSHDFFAVSSGFWMLLVAVLWIAIASAWRLAKFNIDTRQSTGFLGLPTPANALFWSSVVYAFESPAKIDRLFGQSFVLTNIHIPGDPAAPDPWANTIEYLRLLPYLLLGLSLLLGILMLSELPLPSLKFKHKGWKGNEVIFLLIGMGAVLALLYGILAVPLILIIYLLSPLWGKLFPKAH